MPAVSERQRRYMAMCAHSEGASKKGCPTGMTKEQMRDFSFKVKGSKGKKKPRKGRGSSAAAVMGG